MCESTHSLDVCLCVCGCGELCLVYRVQATDVLTMIRNVNKTDVVNLVTHFKTIRRLASASMHELSVLPGIGEKKVRTLNPSCVKPGAG